MFYEAFDREGYYPIDDYDVGNGDNDKRDILLNGPGDAQDLAFSHYSDQIAYWTWGEKGALWISDLSFNNPSVLFVDDEMVYPTDFQSFPGTSINIQWTPDDLHIILNIRDDYSLNLIYHLQTYTIEKWPYHCDRIAMSPRSHKLSTWCESYEENTSFAVIEWGGDIWVSDSPPEEELVNKGDEYLEFWAWSSSGDLAFFDPSSWNGKLSIMNLTGQPLNDLPVHAYWMVEQFGLEKRIVEPLSVPIVWSKNGNRIVIYGISDEKDTCPVFHFQPLDENDQYFEHVPCLHIFDVNTGKLVWSIVDTFNEETLSEREYDELYPGVFDKPVISPDGRILVIESGIFPYDIEAVRVDTGEKIFTFDFILDEISWGEFP